jgi:hypothetical protein
MPLLALFSRVILERHNVVQAPACGQFLGRLTHDNLDSAQPHGPPHRGNYYLRAFFTIDIPDTW